MANRLTRDQLVKLASLGAATRLRELRAEIDAIGALLGARGGRRGARGYKRAGRSSGRPTRRWTAAQRRAARERMKSYWAKRKAKSKKRG